jgi:hypothetical protein
LRGGSPNKAIILSVRKLNSKSANGGVASAKHNKVINAIKRAGKILPGTPAPVGEEDPRWQAIIAIEEFVETQPEAVWPFVQRWGKHPNPDLRAAVATCLLEDLLQHHFDLIFPPVEHEVRISRRFHDMLKMCYKLGKAEKPHNAAKIDRLLRE